MKIKYIFITLIFCLSLNVLSAQSKDDVVILQGKVTSSTDNESLVGATVVEMDAQNRVLSAIITDFNGQYVLKIKSPENKLVISFIGFKSYTQPIGNQRVINAVLQEELQMIDDVSVIAERKHDDGTFPIPEREISTAVQTFNLKEMEGVQVTSIDDALQGRIAGLDIVANSGDPGAGSSMRIRGTTSINANSEPLIVVNGVPYEVEIDENFDFANSNQEQFADMLSINPDDIEEITVLKDAASTAIWGSKGANGVLVIKTKKGVRGPTRVQYSYRATATFQPDGLNILNGDDYTMMMKQAYFNPAQDENAANVPAFLYDPTYLEYENFNNNTDWVDAMTQVGLKQDHYLSFSGGGERARYRFSGGYLNQKGTVIGQQLERFSSRAFLEYRVSDRIKFITDFAFTYTDNDRSYDNFKINDIQHSSLLGVAYRKMPNASIYEQDQYGNNTSEYFNIPLDEDLHNDQKSLLNPVALGKLAKNNHRNYRILPNFTLQYDLLNPEEQMLRYNMRVSFDVNNTKVSKFLPAEASNLYWNDSGVNRAESSDSESMTVMMDHNLTYQPRFSNPDHSVLLYGAVYLRTGNSSSQGLSTTNLPSGEIVDASAMGYFDGNSSSRYSYRSNALTFRGHYAYKSKYIFGLTVRRDGSTKFGNDRKYGTFPGISGKWIISDEPFMDSFRNIISMLAIRPSWGISGNQPGSEYLHYSRYKDYGSYIDMGATVPSTLRLSDLKWETTTSINYGIDLGFLDDRIRMDVNFYKKHTEDLLFEHSKLPSSSGFGEVSWQNVGTMDNDGWELNFYTSNLIKTKDWTIDFDFNLANNKNTIVELKDDILESYNNDFDYNNGSYLSRLQENNSFGSIYGFKYKGVYRYNEYVAGSQESAPVAKDASGAVITDETGKPLPMYFAYGHDGIAYEFQGGDAIYEDVNKDGTIDELDIVYLGNSNPKVNGGFGTTVRYKNFRVRALFNFRYGNKIINKARMYAENMYSLDNQSVAVNYRWRKNGDVTDMPRALYQYGYNWLGSDRFVEDGSFVRFKYLVLGYTFPKAKLKKIGMERLSFNLTFNNLFLWSKYTGVDPEVNYSGFGVSEDWGKTPRSKDCMLGISVTF
ncbi:SusC/RagA family TonB-linked outer membrane protein [Plebeiibacterium marinum]|uniref:SusC/RagA family TonB-linked outer membrane protein n=1 Tax=Plebeiibacterium marinum TaxID=2992111 RepID=A0AAE3MHF2_9BACT|nr:SusC/RagA family TonB-linked outer membrane protein [Plebeiobacterium marinum]MCW3807525.1 SusC/RagA family TonB-linked outer membrane protein [Plebeiobacterium marinum]